MMLKQQPKRGGYTVVAQPQGAAVGWEYRKGRQYYYTAKRVNGRVVKEYHGGGVLAQSFARMDSITRILLRSNESKNLIKYDKKQGEDRICQGYFNDVKAAVEAALQIAGYHKHKGQWRKRRGSTMNAMIAGDANLLTEWSGDKLPAMVGGLNKEELAKSSECNAAVLPRVREILLENPERQRCWGDLALKTLNLILKNMKWATLVDKESIRQRANEIRLSLAGPNPNAIDVLIAERAAICWVEVYVADREVNHTRMDLKLKAYLDFLDRRRDRADRRFMNALKTLAMVRRLRLPDVMAMVQVCDTRA